MKKSILPVAAALLLLVTGHGALLASLLVVSLIVMFVYAAFSNELRVK